MKELTQRGPRKAGISYFPQSKNATLNGLIITPA